MVSMLVSFTLTPMLAARWFKKPKEDEDGSPLPGRGAGDELGYRDGEAARGGEEPFWIAARA